MASKLVKTIGRFMLLVVAGAFMHFDGKAQNTKSSDFQSWNSLGIEKSLFAKKLDIGFNYHLRMDQNVSRVSSHFSEVYVKFDFSDKLSLASGLRYIEQNKDEDGYEESRRYHVDFIAKQKLSRLKLNSRLRFQEKRLSTEIYSNIPEAKLRLRLKASYNIKKVKMTPFVSGEIFYLPEFNDETGWQKIRFTAGFSRKTKSIGKLTSFYRFEQRMPRFRNETGTYMDHIVGINYTFKL